MQRNNGGHHIEATIQIPKISHSEGPKSVKITLQYFEQQNASKMDSPFIHRLHDEATKRTVQFGRKQDITNFFKNL
ncbi:hypothetical protein TNCV_4334821 [Trichonephila clavipes]|nr:hypothetical protein TNCV_4334821 [Trichonephila clavipes]